MNGFIDNLAAYNISGAAANLPEHLVGFQKLLSLVGVSIPSLPIILGSVVGIVAAWATGIKGLHLLQMTALLAVLASGLHTYDLSLVICLLPFLAGVRGWRLAVLCGELSADRASGKSGFDCGCC